MNIFTRIRAFLVLNRAIALANQQHRKHHAAFFVIKNGKLSQRLIIVNKYQLPQLINDGYAPDYATEDTLYAAAFYYTPDEHNRYPMPKGIRKKRQAIYYHWIEYCLWYDKAHR